VIVDDGGALTRLEELGGSSATANVSSALSETRPSVSDTELGCRLDKSRLAT
jgi:hypothetical protein